jgi:hypothetical protein
MVDFGKVDLIGFAGALVESAGIVVVVVGWIVVVGFARLQKKLDEVSDGKEGKCTLCIL